MQVSFNSHGKKHNNYVQKNTNKDLEVIKIGKNRKNTIVLASSIMQKHACAHNCHSLCGSGLYISGGPVNSS